LVTTGAIHLDLYLTGYRTIPTIGWLFLVQVISAFGLAVVVFATPRRVVYAASAGFLVATLGGYLIALHVSLFGFREVRTTAGIVAGVIEIVGFCALAAFASHSDRRATFLIGRGLTAVITLLAALSLALSLATTGAASSTTGGRRVTIKVAQVHGISVLTDSDGYTLYWFAPDSSSSSHCYGTCAAYWPPVIGTPTPSTGVPGSFTTLTRSNGALQVTYDGHPLYTYVGDSAPGQNSGNHIRLNGGWWYEMKASG
jgi:predicted lipoprotein with Yx(FWY)xxD motif